MFSKETFLIVEPFMGGSHQAFVEELARCLPIPVEVMRLPARNWKWRMRLAAPYIAERLQGVGKGRIRGILASSYLDAACFRGLAPLWTREIPLVVYFHENQFVYPVREERERDAHFALTNYTTALAAERVLFNSRYNLESFVEGCETLLARCGDMKGAGTVDSIRRKAEVLPPVMDFSGIDRIRDERDHAGNQPPVIVWNHRWEHDKDPDFFFQALFRLAGERLAFRLVVLGQSFREEPAIFQEARQRLAGHILHFGYASSREEYVRLLALGDVVVSTARHEFFGMSVLEAVRAGCRPLLPARLSYPELFPAEFLYEDDWLPDCLREALRRGRLDQKERDSLTRRFTWEALGPAYCQALGVGR